MSSISSKDGSGLTKLLNGRTYCSKCSYEIENFNKINKTTEYSQSYKPLSLIHFEFEYSKKIFDVLSPKP